MSGPYFEDLHPGWIYSSPYTTLTDGHVAWYAALCGDVNPVFRSPLLYGDRIPLNTSLVAQFAIGQSTLATREVIANLYYKDVVFHRPIFPGTSVRTEVSVIARSTSASRADREPRGKILLGLETFDESEELVMSMTRCALVRKRSGSSDADVLDMLSSTGLQLPFSDAVLAARANWLRDAEAQPPEGNGWRGSEGLDNLADPVTDALQLVRATGNLAKAHRDSRYGQGGQRLVYGGHTI